MQLKQHGHDRNRAVHEMPAMSDQSGTAGIARRREDKSSHWRQSRRHVDRSKPEVIETVVDVVRVRTLMPRYHIEKQFLSLRIDAISEKSRLS